MKNNFKKLGIKVLSMSLACFSLFGAINSTQAMGRKGKGKGGGKKEAPSPMSARAEAFSVETIVETKCYYGGNMEFIFSDGTKCKGVLTPIFNPDAESLHNSMCLLYPNAKLVCDAKLVCACESGEKLEDGLFLPLGTQLKWESGGKSQTLMTLKPNGSFLVHEAAKPLLGKGAFRVVKSWCAQVGICEGVYDWGLQFKSFEEYFFKTIQKGVLHRVLPDLPHVKRILLCVRLAVKEAESSKVEIMPIIELKMSNNYTQTYIFPQSEGFWYEDVLNFMGHMQQLYPTAKVMIQEKFGTQCYKFDMDHFDISHLNTAKTRGCQYPNAFLITLDAAKEDADKLKEEKVRHKKEKEEEEKKIQEEEARKKKEKEEEEKIQAEEARKKREEELEKARKEELAREAKEQRRQEELAKAERLEKAQAEVKRNLKKLSKEAKKESSGGSKESTSSDSSSSSASCEEETEATLTEEKFLTMCSKQGKKSYRKLIRECPHLKEKVLEKAKYVQDNYGLGVADITKLTDGRWKTRLNDEHRLYFTVENEKLQFCQVGEHTLERKGM